MQVSVLALISIVVVVVRFDLRLVLGACPFLMHAFCTETKRGANSAVGVCIPKMDMLTMGSRKKK